MSVPLDRLYNHLDGLCNHDALIYRFYPHGSKKLTDLTPLNVVTHSDWLGQLNRPGAICHDQEPLFFDQYSNDDILDCFIHFAPLIQSDPDLKCTIQNLIATQHIRSVTGSRYSFYDKTLLIHSEMNSRNLGLYEDAGFIGVYWWAHAAIAVDWYRYAQYDQDLEPNFDLITKDFLIYNRAWTGTREYRLKFTELLVNTGLHRHCATTFSSESEGENYRAFLPNNPAFKIQRRDLSDYFDACRVDAAASADYNNYDYQTSAIEVVLETLFDDDRWHLTEKALRPIACGRPFMLAATAGSLQYLRKYGFKTFNGLINESYDNTADPVERLEKICNEMLRISQLPAVQKQLLWTELYKIADYNKKLFFSSEWQKKIFDEFVSNYAHSMEKIAQFKTGKFWKSLRDTWNQDPSKIKLSNPVFIESLKHQRQVEQLLGQKSQSIESIQHNI